MAEYIERDAVLSLAKDICVLTKWDSEYRHRSIDLGDVREIPAADVVPASDFRDCRNELCLRCGQYKTKHLGSCDGCRWEKI